MSFMKPEITAKTDWLEVLSDIGETRWVEANICPHWPIPTDVEVPGDFINPDILLAITQFVDVAAPEAVEYIKLVRGYGARLSAPGYLDSTAWTVFKTLRKAREYLKEQEDDE